MSSAQLARSDQIVYIPFQYHVIARQYTYKGYLQLRPDLRDDDESFDTQHHSRA